jgi:hypothetical protein
VTAPFLSDNGLPGSQSAIAALLQQLTAPPAPPAPGPGAQPAASGSPAPAPPGQVTLNGITMPAPQAAPMPQVVAPPQPQSLAQRIGGLLHAAAGMRDCLHRCAARWLHRHRTRRRPVATKDCSRRSRRSVCSSQSANETPQQAAQRLMNHGMYLMGNGDEEGGAKMLASVGQLSKVLEGPTPKLVKAFETNTKPLRDRAAMIQQAITTVDRAKNSPDPNERHALYSSAIANFVQAADQKAQLRYQLLNYFKENINASVEGRWNLLKDRALKGQLPESTMEGMLTHLHTLKDLTHNEIEAQRSGYVKRYSKLGLDDVLPETDEYFAGADPVAAAPPPAKGGADLYSKYGLTPKKP